MWTEHSPENAAPFKVSYTVNYLSHYLDGWSYVIAFCFKNTLLFNYYLNIPTSWQSKCRSDFHTEQVEYPALQLAPGLATLHILCSCRVKKTKQKGRAHRKGFFSTLQGLHD